MADINLKTLTPDTSLPTTGYLFGADSQAATDPSVYGVTTAITTILGNAASGDALVFNSDTTFARREIRNFRFGAADAATALAQTLSVQSVVAGTSNTAGADWTLTGSQSTGSGAAGNLVLSTAFANTVGTATVTITIATPGVVTWTAHGLVTGSPVVFTTTGALPTGITAGTTYFAIPTGVNTFQIATTAANAAAGTAITTSGSQSGTQTGTTSATVQNSLMPVLTVGPSGLTGSQAASLLDLKQTWNTSGTPTALKVNVVDTASNSSSKLLDLQVGGTTKLFVDKFGNLTITNGANFPVRLANTTYGTIQLASGNVALSGDISSNLQIACGSFLNLISTFTAFSINSDTILSRRGAANWRFGNADAASPVAQTLSVQSVVSGTAGNVAGQDFKITGSQGTGTGAGGSIIFQVAEAGSTATFTVTFTNGSATINGTGLPTTAGTAVAFTTTGALPTNFAINTTYFVLAGSTSTAITVAATAGGTAIVAGSAGSGTQTLTRAVAQNALANAMVIDSVKTVRLGTGYTVATLPAAGTAGRRTYVTDALAPTFLGVLTGGGAVVSPVFDNGTAWVSA
jgi:hypothetical protein